LVTGATDDHGGLTAPISAVVPALVPGNHVLIVVDDRSRYPIRLAFSVLP
jgi:hypothetical protein